MATETERIRAQRFLRKTQIYARTGLWHYQTCDRIQLIHTKRVQKGQRRMETAAMRLQSQGTFRIIYSLLSGQVR